MKKPISKYVWIGIGILLIFILVTKSENNNQIIYGVGVHGGHYDYTSIGSANSNLSLKLLKDLGVTMAREDLTWGTMELTKGNYTFTNVDRRIEILRSVGIETLPILGYSNSLYANIPPGTYWQSYRYTPPRGSQAWEDYKVAFANYIYASVKHLSEKYDMKYYEIWNEPYGFWEPSTESQEERAVKYVELMKVAYPAAKRANPDAQILIGGQFITSNEGSYNRYLFRYGIGDYYDIMNIHPYMDPSYNTKVPYNLQGYYDINNNVNNLLVSFKDLLKEYNQQDKKIWVTEMGVSSDGCTFYRNYSYLTGKFNYYVGYCFQNLSKETQAIRVGNYVKLMKETFPNLEAFFWYDYKEDGFVRAYDMAGCGWVVVNSTCPVHHEARFGLIDWNYQPKPAYYAYQKVIKENA